MWSGTRGLLVISFLTGLGLATEPECRANGPKVNSGNPSVRSAATNKKKPFALERPNVVACLRKTIVSWAIHGFLLMNLSFSGEILTRGPAATQRLTRY